MDAPLNKTNRYYGILRILTLFILGVGKGVVGLVARPTGGLVDSASGIMHAAKRVTEVSVEINR